MSVEKTDAQTEGRLGALLPASTLTQARLIRLRSQLRHAPLQAVLSVSGLVSQRFAVAFISLRGAVRRFECGRGDVVREFRLV